MKHLKSALTAVACAALVAACGPGSGGEATTSTAAAPATTVAPAPTTTTAAATTSTDSPGTTGPPQATGDLRLLQDAMSTTVDAQPTRVEGTMQIRGAELEEGEATDVEMPFTVTTDPATGNSAMVMDLGAMVGAMAGEEGIDAEMAEMFGSMEIRQIDEIAYLKFPFFTAFMGAETEWVSMPADEDAAAPEGFGTGGNPTNPGSFLEAFSDAEGQVELIGPDDVRGISTTHFRLIVDESWQDALSEEELAELEAQGPIPDAEFPIDLWIDDGGLVQRMAMIIDGSQIPDEADDEFDSMTMTFDFYGFGESVVIEPPPADQVTDASELAGPFGTMAP